MAQQQYTEKPHKVMAEQYDAQQLPPLQDGVCTCADNPQLWTDGRPHVHTSHGMIALSDGDWILMDPWTPDDYDVLSAEEFDARYGQTAADASVDIDILPSS